MNIQMSFNFTSEREAVTVVERIYTYYSWVL